MSKQKMSGQKILGLDLGSNSIGWALLEREDDRLKGIIDAGCRIFNKAVEEKNSTPKNVNRRNKRLFRRVLQRRARRKKRMLNYLVKLKLLPDKLIDNPQPEIILNDLGNPYKLRKKALDHRLSAYELGRIFFHLVQRRGFLSSKKTLLGDMLDDPDVLGMLEEQEQSSKSNEDNKEETAFKKDIVELRQKIEEAGCRTLGEYLATLDHHDCKRNRSREGGHLRTDRQMYKDELDLIWEKQSKYHSILDKNVKHEIGQIIFSQRPLKLKPGRQGACSLEPSKKRARWGRLEAQRFRYLQDINNLQYKLPDEYKWVSLGDEQRQKLIDNFEHVQTSSFDEIKTILKLPERTEFNLETDVKKLKGNSTSVKIRDKDKLPEWDDWPAEKQYALVEDMITIMKKSVLKKRLQTHWQLPSKTAVKLCMIEFEPGHANLSSKAIKKLLPFLRKGQIFSEAKKSAGYGHEENKMVERDRLGPPPDIPNPIVSKGLHELRRVINAIIAIHGKPDAIRLEMARDLEMNTEKHKSFSKQQKENTKTNKEAVIKYQEIRGLSEYPSKDKKIRYRLWKDQDRRCAYSNKMIPLATLFSAEIEIDHIIPYSLSLDGSYMNKVICLSGENRYKGQRTPIDAFGGNQEKWNQITEAVNSWSKKLRAKKDRFHLTGKDVIDRDFPSSQLNDTRYICREALRYLSQLGQDVDVTTTKGFIVSRMRHLWGLDNLIGGTDSKDRTDHRHHTIDAVVIASIDRKFHKTLVKAAKIVERNRLELKTNKLRIPSPWETICSDTGQILDKLIVSHAPQKKVSGELNEATGAWFIEGEGTFYRKDLDGGFTLFKARKIIDPFVKKIVIQHLEKYDNKPKEAFAQGKIVYHKDGKTPVKRVRIKQASTIISLEKLGKGKFGARNQQGKLFKWLPYGNFHHVEIIKDKETGDYTGEFVTMMEARRRALTGTKNSRKKGVLPESVIKTDHGDKKQFVMALHKNDTVSLNSGGNDLYYRIQKLDRSNKKIELRLHTAATIKNISETFPGRESTIPALMEKGMKKVNINILGKSLND